MVEGRADVVEPLRRPDLVVRVFAFLVLGYVFILLCGPDLELLEVVIEGQAISRLLDAPVVNNRGRKSLTCPR